MLAELKCKRENMVCFRSGVKDILPSHTRLNMSLEEQQSKHSSLPH